MPAIAEEKADYGSWIPAKFIQMPGILSLVFAGLALLVPVLGVIAALFFVSFLYFAYARHRFSPRGGDIQSKVLGLVLDHMKDWDGRGKVLDIGCGSGPLAIQIAKRYPQAEVFGIDNWGAAWEYSKAICDRNAAIEGVAERIRFESAGAASLPFDDESFDLVVSNLVFHEVRGVRDKRQLIREALRVVKKGRWFVLQDLLLWKQVYGEAHDLLDTIRSWEIESVELVDTSASGFIPKALKLPFMLGTVGLVYGRK